MFIDDTKKRYHISGGGGKETHWKIQVIVF